MSTASNAARPRGTPMRAARLTIGKSAMESSTAASAGTAMVRLKMTTAVSSRITHPFTSRAIRSGGVATGGAGCGVCIAAESVSGSVDAAIQAFAADFTQCCIDVFFTTLHAIVLQIGVLPEVEHEKRHVAHGNVQVVRSDPDVVQVGPLLVENRKHPAVAARLRQRA